MDGWMDGMASRLLAAHRRREHLLPLLPWLPARLRTRLGANWRILWPFGSEGVKHRNRNNSHCEAVWEEGTGHGARNRGSRVVCTIHAVTIHTLDLFFAGGLGRRRCWHVGRDAARSTARRGGTRNHNHTFNKPTVVVTIANP